MADLPGRMVKGCRYSDFPVLKETCEEFLVSFPFCSHAQSLLVSIYTEENQSAQAKKVGKSIQRELHFAHHFEKILEQLIKTDVIRAKYWTYRMSVLQD